MLEINQGAEKSIKLKSLKNHCSVCEKEQKKVHDLSHFLQIWVPFFFPPKSCWSLKWYSYIFALPLCQSNVLGLFGKSQSKMGLLGFVSCSS